MTGRNGLPEHRDQGFPGPAAYDQVKPQSIPGFTMVPETAKVNRTDEAGDQKTAVGPGTYTPFNPSLQ